MSFFCFVLSFIAPFVAYAQNDSSMESGSGGLVSIAFPVIVICYVVFNTIGFIWRYRCPKCKKWWVMRQEKKELLNTDIETEVRKEEIKDNNGNVLRVEEVKVPILVHHYEIWRKCKRCGHLVRLFEDKREEKYDRTTLKS